MEGAEENQKNSNFPFCMSWVSKDLLNEFSKQTNFLPNENIKNEEEEEDGELQLSLGLSMNGKFGVDPTKKKLRRWSSTVNAVDVASGSDQARGGHAPLLRTLSMPAEGEEEWRRRKAVESMEARKLRMEKLKSVKIEPCVEEKLSCGNQFCEGGVNNASVGVRNRGGGIIIGAENLNVNVNVNVNANVLFPSSQGSMGSQGSRSSGFSDQQIEVFSTGINQNPEVKSPSGVLPPPVQVEQPLPNRAADTNAEEGTELLRTALLNMPNVTTVGPNGNRVTGFLYKYRNGEDVKIVCVCHGLFLSPADFIRHAGGGDVEHPLRHIVVSHSPLF